MKLKIEILSIAIQLVIFTLLLFLLSVALKTCGYSLSDNIFLKDLAKNWSKGAISNFYTVNLKDTCPPQTESFFQELFQINIEGCDCRKSYYYGLTSDIFPGKCSYVMNLVGCTNIGNGASESRLMQTWKNAKICVSRSDASYYDIITTSKTECPSDYHQCGVDSNHFRLCYPNKFECPINTLLFSNNENIKDKMYTGSIKLNADWVLYYSNKSVNNSLIVDVKYSEGRICVNPKEKNLKENFLHFKHNNNYNNYNSNFNIKKTCLSKLGKITFDERFSQIDTTSKFKFYHQNGILPYFDTLPNYKAQEMINSHSYLYSRSYIYWSPHCNSINGLSGNTILQDLSDLSIYDGFFDVLVYFSIFLLIFFIVLVPLSKMYQNNYFQVIYSILLILVTVCLITASFTSLMLYHKSNLTSKLANLKCGDYISNHSINKVGENMNKLLFSCFKMIICLSVLIILIISQLFLKLKH